MVQERKGRLTPALSLRWFQRLGVDFLSRRIPKTVIAIASANDARALISRILGRRHSGLSAISENPSGQAKKLRCADEMLHNRRKPALTKSKTATANSNQVLLPALMADNLGARAQYRRPVRDHTWVYSHPAHHAPRTGSCWLARSRRQLRHNLASQSTGNR